MPITYVLSYGLQFAGLASLLTHTACWHGKDIWRQWTRSLKEAGDEGEGAHKAVSGTDPQVLNANGQGERKTSTPKLKHS
jgi:hypothetical protein